MVSYVLEMNVEHLSEHQNKPSDADRYDGYFSPHVSLISMCIL